jgi:hypothetical protein
MSKYKNKDGIELSFTGKDEFTKLVKEVVSKAVGMCDEYNKWDKNSSEMALDKIKKFLKENFNLEEKNG